MKQHSRRRSSLRSFATLLATAVLGCTREEVSLGSGQEVEEAADNPCGDGIVLGSVLTETQDDLEELRGCTEVMGDLELHGFPGMDLTPLSALRIVRGNLYVGTQGPLGGSPIGTISSLEGLEALEQVNSLTLSHLTVPDLSGLSSLRAVAFDPLGPHEEGGLLYLRHNTALRDLSGLDSLTDFAQLATTDNAQLESLSGLRVPHTLRSVHLSNEPVLTDLSALGELTSIGELYLENTAITELDALQVKEAELIMLVNNDLLEHANSLSLLVNLRELAVAGNDRLQELPALENTNGFAILNVVGNAQLRSVPSFRSGIGGGLAIGSLTPVLGPSSFQSTTYYGFDVFEVGMNPMLTRIDGMGSAPLARQVAIYDNARLTEVNLGPISSLSVLHVVNNAALTSLQLTQPAQVAHLTVQDNPLFSTAPLAGVQTLSTQMSGNLD